MNQHELECLWSTHSIPQEQAVSFTGCQDKSKTLVFHFLCDVERSACKICVDNMFAERSVERQRISYNCCSSLTFRRILFSLTHSVRALRSEGEAFSPQPSETCNTTKKQCVNVLSTSLNHHNEQNLSLIWTGATS